MRRAVLLSSAKATLLASPRRQPKTWPLLILSALQRLTQSTTIALITLPPGRDRREGLSAGWLQSMAEPGMVAIVRIVLRSRQALGVLRVYRDSLALETMFYPDEVRPITGLPAWNRDFRIQENELKMARQLIENLTGSFFSR